MAVNEFELKIRENGEVVCVSLTGDLDLAVAEDFDRELRHIEATSPRYLVLDLRSLGFIDSTGLQALLKADARSRSNGFRLEIVRGSDNVQRVFRVTGMDEYLPMVDEPREG